MQETQYAQVPVVVLAGGSPDDPLAVAHGIPVKALVPVAGKPSLLRVMGALADSGLTQIAVSTAASAAEEVRGLVPAGVQVTAAPGPHITDSLMAGLDAVGPAARVLVVTADLPLLTPEALHHFLGEALSSGAELVYSIVRAEDVQRAYGPGRRLLVKLREGRFTGGNVFLLSPDFARRVVPTIEQAFAGRKNPVALARLLGFGFVLRFLLGLLDLPAIVRRAEHLLDCTAAVVVSPYAEVCFDLDKPAHLEVAEAVLAGGFEA